jgi:hypothetical protein
MRWILVALAGVLALSLAGVAGADTNVADPAGDSGGAPDILSVAVSNDAGSGQITFRITTNQPTLAEDSALFMFIDSDKNSATGDRDGDDYLVYMDNGGSDFAHWNGSDYDTASTPHATVLYGYANGVATFTVNKSELGNTTSFLLGVSSDQFDSADNIVATDYAPDRTLIDYTLTVKPLVLTVGKPVGKPAPPTAGKAFVVTVPVKRSDTGKLATGGGTVTCKVTVGGKAVKAAGRFSAAGPQCILRVPAKTKGKTIRGSATVTIKSVKVTKGFSFRVA